MVSFFNICKINSGRGCTQIFKNSVPKGLSQGFKYSDLSMGIRRDITNAKFQLNSSKIINLSGQKNAVTWGVNTTSISHAVLLQYHYVVNSLRYPPCLILRIWLTVSCKMAHLSGFTDKLLISLTLTVISSANSSM